MIASKPEAVVSLIGKIHERANEWIELQLREKKISGLAPSHGDILAALYRNGAMTMGDLAEAIRRKKNTVTVLARKLIAGRYVKIQRDSGDSRIKRLALTKKALTKRSDIQEISRELIEKMYQEISEAEKKTLVNLLDRIYFNLSGD